MVHQIWKSIEGLAVLSTAASIVYYALCLIGALRSLWQRKENPSPSNVGLPPVSVLKPLKGTDPEMYQSFRSHCLQNYPQYEIIFGVSDPQDAAITMVERLKKEFPKHSIRLVICEKNLGTNTKVSNLAQMLPEARYEHLIVNDSDIRVEQDYLRRVVVPLQDKDVGLVTCLYRGVPAKTLGSHLESLGISTDFAAGVLVAQMLEGVRFGLGSTLVFRRSDLQSMGGFEGFVDYLADDYEIGNRTTLRGLRVKLSETVVETFLPAYTFAEFFQHQVRWARSVRDSRRWGYIGLGLTFGLPWALFTLVLAHGARWSWGLLAVTLGARIAVAATAGRLVLQDRNVVPQLWLLPLRDLVALGIWIVSFAGHTVAWRGDLFKLRDGKLVRVGL